MSAASSGNIKVVKYLVQKKAQGAVSWIYQIPNTPKIYKVFLAVT